MCRLRSGWCGWRGRWRWVYPLPSLSGEAVAVEDPLQGGFHPSGRWGPKPAKPSAALLRAAAARRLQNGAAVAAHLYRQRAQATPPRRGNAAAREGAEPQGTQARPPSGV